MPKKIHVLFYASFSEALSQSDELKAQAPGAKQLNVVIREEGNMDDPALLDLHPHIKVYAGEAWNLIHERRVKDGWYEQQA